MEGFKKLPKGVQCFKEGGAVYKSRHSEKSEVSEDIAKDKQIVKKAVSIHDKQQHEGKKTDLTKLKKGGRAKKEVGNVKKFEKASGEYGAKKDAADIENIKGAKQFKPVKLCAGKSVKKYADGGSIIDTIKQGARSLKENVMGTPEQNRLALEREKRIRDRKAAEAAATNPVTAAPAPMPTPAPAPAPMPTPAPAPGAAPMGNTPSPMMPGGMKKGGKAKKDCK